MLVRERKEILRGESRTRLRSWAESPCSVEAGERVQEHFLQEFPPRAGMAVALYCALDGEISTGRIRTAYIASGASLYYPRVGGGRTLSFYPHREGDPWESGPYGIPQPPVPAGVLPRTAGWNIVVVPGLAFDRGGNRLGRGFGYYDRFLAGLPDGVPRVGLACSGLVVPEVPVDAWDVPVHVLVTEEGVIRVAEASVSADS